MKKDSKINILNIPEGELSPMFIKASHVPRLIIGVSAGHLANMRSKGCGPRFYLIGGAVYYTPEDLELYYGSHQVQTTNAPIPKKQLTEDTRAEI